MRLLWLALVLVLTGCLAGNGGGGGRDDDGGRPITGDGAVTTLPGGDATVGGSGGAGGQGGTAGQGGSAGQGGAGGQGGDCLEGTTDQSACGLNNRGTRTRDCDGGTWASWGACADPDLCVDATVQDGECGLNNRGQYQRVCRDGQFSDWGACADPDACLDGARDTRACGPNGRGEEVRRCDRGQWSSWGACGDADTCTDGEQDIEACGINDRGRRSRTCNGGRWGNWNACDDPDACRDGDLVERVCEGNGRSTRTCDRGQWGVCVPPDCRQVPCAGLNYCDRGTGLCHPGCENSAQCGPGQVCEVAAHTCICDDGWHVCGGTCSANHSVQSCGDRCEPCAEDPLGTTACIDETCEITCDDGASMCDGVCDRCPVGGVASTTCRGQACVARACEPINHKCGDTWDDCCGWSSVGRGWIADDARNPSLHINDRGHWHVAYYNLNDTTLWYAKYDLRSFTNEQVHDHVQAGAESDITSDSAGNPHIAYLNSRVSDLRYAVRGARGGWSNEVIDAPGRVGFSPSLMLAADDTPHVVYYDETNTRLMHGAKNGDAWVLTAIDGDAEGSDVGAHASAVMHNGAIHAAYVDATNGRIKYAMQTAGGWRIENIDDVAAAYLSLVVGDDGAVWLAFQDTNRADLMLARREGNAWAVENIYGSDRSGRHARMTLDSDGYPFIAHVKSVPNQHSRFSGLFISRYNGTEWDHSQAGYHSYGALDVAMTPQGEPRITASYLPTNYIKTVAW
jgi:hypothetical protein